MILTIKIEAKDKVEAYKAVSEAAMEHQVIEAEFDGRLEVFDEQNQPKHFLKNRN